MQKYIAEDILELLNVDSLLNAEQVSEVWKQAIVEGKLWKKLFERQTVLHQVWRSMCVILERKLAVDSEGDCDDTQHRKFKENCLLISDAVKTLESNWNTGNSITEEFLCNELFSSLLAIEFQMDDQWIVRCRKAEGTFQVFNRWTLKLENVIEVNKF